VQCSQEGVSIFGKDGPQATAS